MLEFLIPAALGRMLALCQHAAQASFGTVGPLRACTMPKAAKNASAVKSDAQARLDNRSKQMNPNHPAYWGSRAQKRPEDFSKVSELRSAQGLREAQINQAARDQNRAAAGRDTRRVEQVVKQLHGGQSRVERGGSRAKHTNLTGADNDLKVVMPLGRPMNMDDRRLQKEGLEREFGNVDDSNPRVLKVRGEAGMIDVVPSQSTYSGEGFHAGLPLNPFTHNNAARMAVRDVKLWAEERGVKLRGYNIEQAVLETQLLSLFILPFAVCVFLV